MKGHGPSILEQNIHTGKSESNQSNMDFTQNIKSGPNALPTTSKTNKIERTSHFMFLTYCPRLMMSTNGAFIARSKPSSILPCRLGFTANLTNTNGDHSPFFVQQTHAITQ